MLAAKFGGRVACVADHGLDAVGLLLVHVQKD
jgi:hypothetical protein